MIALYTRVSTQEQAREGYSISEQAERLKDYCKAMNWPVYKLYSDPGYSGSNTDRPALTQMLRDAASGRFQKVLVYKLDRLSRSQKDTLHIIEDELLIHGVDFVSMTENFDTSSPMGKAMIGILAVFAQLEREQIKERMNMGKDARAKKGLHICTSIVPAGYRSVDGRLEIDPYESAIIKRVFSEYAAGRSMRDICKSINSDGLYIKNRPLERHGLRYLLRNATYTGKIRYQGKYMDGQHDPIIDDDTFEKVQSILSRRSDVHAQNRREGKAQSYLGGMLYCGCCGKKLIKTTQGKYTYYVCDSRLSGNPCSLRYIRMDKLDAMVTDEIRKLALDPEAVKPSQPPDSVPVTDEIAVIDKKLERLIDLYAAESIPKDALQTRIAALQEQKQAILDRMNDAETFDAMPVIQSFSDILSSGDFAAIRTTLTALIDKIIVRSPDDIIIYWRFS